jgi:hypothetical protein
VGQPPLLLRGRERLCPAGGPDVTRMWAQRLNRSDPDRLGRKLIARAV